MKKSQISHLPNFFDRYIHLAPDIHIVEALQQEVYTQDEIATLLQVGDKVYAPNKWTIKSILQHVMDNERIQSYRALRFARKDNTILPGYDEQLFGDNSYADRRDLKDLLEEFNDLRKSTIKLYESFTSTMLQQEGICFNTKISVLALGFVIAGHKIHHSNIIRERYLPLVIQEGNGVERSV